MDSTVPVRAVTGQPRRPAVAGRVPPVAGGGRGLPPVHETLICVALPCLALSAAHGQLTGEGVEGVYRSGRRVLAVSRLRIAGGDPVPVLGRMVSAGLARFMAVARTPADIGPDPGVAVERTRDAEGTERITFRSALRQPVRLPVELELGTDLAELGAVATGTAGPGLPASVHGSGLRWTAPDGRHSTVSAVPAPKDALALASAGLLRWELELPPGAARTIELRVGDGRPTRPAGRAGAGPLAEARVEGDDPRVERFLGAAQDDLRALLVRDPARPADLHAVAGAPWRCGLAPAEALWAARMALPLGTRLAAATLRVLARARRAGSGADEGRIPGPLRDAGPHLPPGCTGAEATLAFPAVLAEARRWGMPEQEVAELLPAAEGCLRWLRSATDATGLVRDPGATGLRRAETQAHAHRALLLGAALLAECGRPDATEWQDRAGALRARFREEFWLDDPSGGRPAAALTDGGRPLPHLGGAAAHLLDTGLLGGGRLADGLLDEARTGLLARLLGAPALDSGWGLRGLGTQEPGHSPFGHRAGAVRVHETAVAVTGLAAAGHDRSAASLARGLLDAAEVFGYRLPEMYAGEQRAAGSVPVPHPAACRPAAVASAAAVQILVALAGVRPDAPARTVALQPVPGAPLGAFRLAGLRVAGEPFAVRVTRQGLGMIEEAADGLQLGV
ncbi:glycogen debranching protein [Streptomyces sp. LP05-1]|uniref:Glycogen debranching protein n=1 Tax=Streptomyces pyxinae TaxID=2970734 RepID=A0ABT2CJM3_9ACTN|nr:glycogen debranching N-terminal domain-containing protein [Streptomyces sp. LP05-1]MCS0637619.1 glycogen debranching protein [Streptomyces sp. LP05-1]